MTRTFRRALIVTTAIFLASGTALEALPDEKAGAGGKTAEKAGKDKGESKSGGEKSPRGGEKASPGKGGAPVDHSPAKDTRSEGQKTVDRNMENAARVSRETERQRDKEQMRDKSHDGRVKVGDGVSVGGTVDAKDKGATVDVKIDTDKPKKQ